MIDKISWIFATYNLFKVYLLKIGPIFVDSSPFYLNKNMSEFVFPPGLQCLTIAIVFELIYT